MLTSQAAVVAPPVSVTASSEFAAEFAVSNLFDATVASADIDLTPYGQGDGQWAGVGVGPFDVFMDFGSTVSDIDGLGYSQRLGGNPVLDKVGRIDLWFSNSDFGGAIPGTAPNASVQITNTTNTVFTQYTFGPTSFDARYVAAQFFSTPGATAGNIGGSEFRLLTDTPDVLDPPNIDVTVNRATGQIMLRNTGATPLSFVSYQLNSPTAGALDASNWRSIAENYDAGSPGPNQVDATDHWIEFTPAPFIGTLGEGELPGGDGAELSNSKPINLGNAWIRNPMEDLELLLLLDDGSFFPADVVYIGDPLVVGDLNFNGDVEAGDWPLFRSGLGGIHSTLTPAQAYVMGDLDGDGDTDIVDFRQFEAMFDAANGSGALTALINSNAVPESSTALLLISGGAALVRGRARRHRSKRVLLLAPILGLAVFSSQDAQAQTFTLTTPPTPTAAIANSEFGGTFVVGSLFDDTNIAGDDIGIIQYGGGDLQYAGVGPEPKEIFMDFGQSISANYLSFAQRIGGDPLADKIGEIELWFSNSDFGGVLPTTPADVAIPITDLSLGATATLQPYSLGDVFSGQYVAARLNIADVSTGQPVNNIGGNELRLATGPSDVVLQVDRATGNMTIRNEGTLAQALDINAYEIRSDAGSLLASWVGIENGSVSGFPAGNGSGNGWEKGDLSNANLLAEAYLQNTSTLGTGSVVPLGVAYNNTVDAQDLMFSISIANGNGLLFRGVVEYINAPPALSGDYNDNGVVDAADYVLWRNGGPLANDPTPGLQPDDYTFWRSRFGATSGSGRSVDGGAVSGTAVPEPAAGFLALVLAGIAFWSNSRFIVRKLALERVVAVAVAMCVAPTIGWGATPDAIYLFGDNSALTTENGAPGVGVGQAVGADAADATLDHAGDPTSTVLETFRDLVVNTAVPSSRPVYVNTAALNYPGTNLGSTTTGIGVHFDGVNDTLGDALGLGWPQQGDDAFTGDFQDAYSQIFTRIIDGWVRPANPNSGSRQDIVNDTYQFGIHITGSGTWGMNFGSTNGEVNTFDFDSGVSVASTLDANGWAHVEQRTIGSGSAALYVNGELLLVTGDGNPFYHPAAASASGDDLEISFGSNLAGDGNFFAGEVDNFRLIIAGDNSGFFANGMNYGNVDLSIDNDYIAANVVRGDANGDGLVNGDGTGLESVDDVAFFVNHFLHRQLVTDLNGAERQIGDITSVTTMADFSGDGITDIRDWFILTQEHEDAAMAASLNLGALLAAKSSAPEPGTIVLGGIGFACGWSLCRRSRGLSASNMRTSRDPTGRRHS
jgi:hypothetical protein